MKENKIKSQNQQINQRKDKDTIDKVGNQRFRLFFKSGNATILVAKGLTRNQIKILTGEFKSNLDNYNSKIEGVWLVIK